MQTGTPKSQISDADAPAQRGSRWYAAAVVAAAAVLFLARLGARALWSSEGRWAEIVREMQLNSNYFWPTINGKLYYDKPLLSYWFIVAATRLTGTIDEAAARLPSALFALAGVGLVIALARRLYGRTATAAALAGFILATSYSYVFFARHASADIETTTGVLAALTLFAWHREHPDGWWVVWLWLIMAATSLTKGLMGFALPLGVMGLYSLLEQGTAAPYAHPRRESWNRVLSWFRQRLAWLFNFKTPIAVLAAGLLYYLPFAISHRRSHSDAGIYMVFRENVVRFFNPFDHRDPVYVYLYVIFALMAPWSIFLPAALLEVHRKERRAGGSAPANSDLFTLVYFWGTLAFFTISRSRRSYYLLPILPAAALMVARLLSTQTDRLWAPARRLMNIGYGILIVGVVVLGGAFLLPASLRPGALRLLPASPARPIFAVLWLISLAGIVHALRRMSVGRVALSTGAVAYLVLFFLFVVAMPQAEQYRYEKSFARAVRSSVDGNTAQLALYRIWGPGLIYYLAMPHPIPLFDSPDRLAGFAESKGGAWVITREEDARNMKLQTEPLAAEPELPWESPSQRRSRHVLLKVR
ncbi:MAG TPA: glycosyltransferase family 39 protein [Candidatus Binataceae bacterium]|nr:glycosyltransferase family 39 protein [Candidatus Binataceae bacterium]